MNKIKSDTFEIYPQDLGIFNWTDALNACNKIGEGWRIPMPEELHVMHENIDKIEDLDVSYDYWAYTKDLDGTGESISSFSFSEGICLEECDGNNSRSKYRLRPVRTISFEQDTKKELSIFINSIDGFKFYDCDDYFKIDLDQKYFIKGIINAEYTNESPHVNKYLRGPYENYVLINKTTIWCSSNFNNESKLKVYKQKYINSTLQELIIYIFDKLNSFYSTLLAEEIRNRNDFMNFEDPEKRSKKLLSSINLFVEYCNQNKSLPYILEFNRWEIYKKYIDNLYEINKFLSASNQKQEASLKFLKNINEHLFKSKQLKYLRSLNKETTIIAPYKKGEYIIGITEYIPNEKNIKDRSSGVDYEGWEILKPIYDTIFVYYVLKADGEVCKMDSNDIISELKDSFVQLKLLM